MATGMMPIRRVVMGNDERGQSKVVWDGPAPNAQPTSGSGTKPLSRSPGTATMGACRAISRAQCNAPRRLLEVGTRNLLGLARVCSIWPYHRRAVS